MWKRLESTFNEALKVDSAELETYFPRVLLEGDKKYDMAAEFFTKCVNINLEKKFL